MISCMPEPVLTLVRRPEDDDVQWLLRRAEHLRCAHEAVDAAFARRDSDEEAFAAWERRAAEFRAACELMYPQVFWEDVRRLADGDPRAVEPALIFLEADPWCFRSGYAKETVVRLLRRHRLTLPQGERLDGVLLHVVEVGDRREFALYCQLAAVNATPTLRDGLKHRLFDDRPGVSRRALVMLTSLRRPRLTPPQAARALQIISENAPKGWWTGRQIRQLTSRFGPEE